jgi:hypothetical protein
VRISLTENKKKDTSLMEHMINLVETMTDKEISESLQRTRPELKAVRLMLKKHLINIA